MQLLPTLLQTVRKATNFHSTLNLALGQICELTDWDYGEVWIPDRDGKILQLSPATYINIHKSKDCISALEQFRLCSQAFILLPGIGLPGRVWRRQKPEWICDVSVQSETYFLRHYIAKAFGVKTGFGVPIIADDRVLAVLVFFMLSVRPEDKELIELVAKAVLELGVYCNVNKLVGTKI